MAKISTVVRRAGVDVGTGVGDGLGVGVGAGVRVRLGVAVGSGLVAGMDWVADFVAAGASACRAGVGSSEPQAAASNPSRITRKAIKIDFKDFSAVIEFASFW